MQPSRRGGGSGRVALGLAVVLSLLALIQANHRALQGRSALLRWEPDFQAFWGGEPLYHTGADEGYPTLPVTLVVMQPFRALGPHAGAVTWALFKIGLAWWIVTRALALAAGRARDFPGPGQLAVLVLSFRVLSSDIQHGNLNLLVGAAVAAAAWSWNRRRPVQAGFWLGWGAALKVTPALGLLWLLRKRSALGMAGFALGIALGLLLPAPFVGLERTLDLDRAWWEQMVTPYVRGREWSLMQTEHINQSLLGVLARYLTDAVAIEAHPPRFAEDVHIGVLALGPSAFRAVHLVACALVAGLLLRWVRSPAAEGGTGAPGRVDGECIGEHAGPSDDAHGAWRSPRGLVVLGDFALLALAMLMLSERSWKHHYVLLAFPLTFLMARLIGRDARATDATTRRLAITGVVSSALLHGASGSAFLGDRGSDLAEALGVHLIGAIVLFVCTGACLACDARAARRDSLVE